MTTLKEKILFRLKRQLNCKIENCQGCEHETKEIMSEIAAYTKRVVGEQESVYMDTIENDVMLGKGLGRQEMWFECGIRAREEGVEV